MKYLLSICLLFASVFTINAQTKEETIEYLEGKMRKYVRGANYSFTEIDIKATPCEIIVNYKARDGNIYRLIMPTDGLEIQNYGSEITGFYCLFITKENRITRQNMNNGYSKIDYTYSAGFELNKGEPDLYTNLKKNIDHLASFCNKRSTLVDTLSNTQEIITSTESAQTQKETIKWLEKVMNKYGQVEGPFSEKAPVVSITPCEIRVEYIINYTNHYRLTIPTNGLTIKANGHISTGTFRVLKERLDYSESDIYSYFSSGYKLIEGEPDLYIQVKKAMDHLATFCITQNNNANNNSIALDDDCSCPRPKDGHFLYLWTLTENKDPNYDNHLQRISCVDKEKDTDATIREKVNCTWEKYYAEWICNSTGFSVGDGNVLKYAVNEENELFVDGMVQDFGININLRDPADGKTLLDFVSDEILRYRNDENYGYKAPELELIYNHFKNDLNAKHAIELTAQDVLPYSVKKIKISLPTDGLKKYEGKYVAENYNPVYIKVENDKLLYSFGDNAKYFELSADSKTSFFRKPTPAFANSEFIFKLNEVTGKYDLIVNQNSSNIIFKRAE